MIRSLAPIRLRRVFFSTQATLDQLQKTRNALRVDNDKLRAAHDAVGVSATVGSLKKTASALIDERNALRDANKNLQKALDSVELAPRSAADELQQKHESLTVIRDNLRRDNEFLRELVCSVEQTAPLNQSAAPSAGDKRQRTKPSINKTMRAAGPTNTEANAAQAVFEIGMMKSITAASSGGSGGNKQATHSLADNDDDSDDDNKATSPWLAILGSFICGVLVHYGYAEHQAAKKIQLQQKIAQVEREIVAEKAQRERLLTEISKRAGVTK